MQSDAGLEHRPIFRVVIENIAQLKNRKRFWWVLGVVGTLTALAISSNEIIEWLIVKKLKNNSELPYSIEFSDVDFNLLSLRVAIDSLTVESQDSTGKELQLSATYAALHGWNWFAFLRHSRFEAGNVELTNPTFLLRQGKAEQPKDTATSASENSLIRLESIHISTIDIRNGTARIYQSGQDSATVAVDSFYTTIKSYSQYRRISRDSFDVADAQVQVKRLSLQTKDRFYNLVLKDIDAMVAQQELKIGSFDLIPRYTKQRFAKALGEQKGRLDLKTSGIEARNFQFKQLFQQQILLDYLHINEINFVVTKDKSVLKRDESKKELPHWVLQQTDWTIRLDTTRVRMANIRYDELNELSEQSGYVDFQRSAVSLYNITNVDSLIQKNPYIEVDVLSYFMGAGKLQAHFRFDLTSTAYSYSGSLGEMDLPDANVACIPMALLEIQSGHINELTFDIQANDDVAKGTMEFDYENFKINLLKDKEEKKKGILSFLANTLALKNKNTKEKKNFRTGIIYSERDKSRSFFHHLWTALRSGLQSTLLPDIVNNKLEKDQELK